MPQNNNNNILPIFEGIVKLFAISVSRTHSSIDDIIYVVLLGMFL